MCGTIGPAKWEGLSDRQVFSGSLAVGPMVFTSSVMILLLARHLEVRDVYIVAKSQRILVIKSVCIH